MTLLSYQVFQTVVGQGSFQKAAEILNLTPSAVSLAIASMEQELGFSLFTRNKAGVALTNYGEHLLPYVNAVLNSDESLQQAIAGLNGLKMGNVKVGGLFISDVRGLRGPLEKPEKKKPGFFARLTGQK